MKAEKLIETKEEGEYKTLKYHVIKNIDLPEDELLELCEYYDDYEEAYSAGIYSTIDGDVHCIDVDNFIEQLENDIIDEDDKHKMDMVKKLEKYKGYTIYFED